MSRKYRQRGYQDDEPRERSPRGGSSRERGDRPRGRGLGAPTATLFRCARCGRREDPRQVSFDAVCAGCGSDLHTCTNCRHFDTSAPNECREEVPQRIGKKASRNRCEPFAPKTVSEFERDGIEPDDPKAAFDALFKL